MTDGGSKATAADLPAWRGLLHPGIPILLIANLYPLIGVVLWGWDAFLLLMLYWMETVIVAFWTIVRIAQFPPGAAGALEASGGRKVTAPLGDRGLLHAPRRDFHRRAPGVPLDIVFRRLVEADRRPARHSSGMPSRRKVCGCRCCFCSSPAAPSC